MERTETLPQCPGCGLVDSPRLIVRGDDTSPIKTSLASVLLQCRSCRSEWSERSPVGWIQTA
jgi:hypothetical protein